MKNKILFRIYNTVLIYAIQKTFLTLVFKSGYFFYSFFLLISFENSYFEFFKVLNAGVEIHMESMVNFQMIVILNALEIKIKNAVVF
jgi:hypothetical protein